MAKSKKDETAESEASEAADTPTPKAEDWKPTTLQRKVAATLTAMVEELEKSDEPWVPMARRRMKLTAQKVGLSGRPRPNAGDNERRKTKRRRLRKAKQGAPRSAAPTPPGDS